MKVVEFCCGMGGASAGMLAAGLEIEASYDLWPVAVKQHRLWHPEVPCEVRDIATVTPDELAGRFVWASLPCQPWSTANVHPEKRGKKHAHYYSLAHFARQVQHARVALVENVPGLLWSKEGQAEVRELEAECVRLGLGMSIHLVYSNWFGVSQARRRVFILIARDLPLVLIQAGQTTGALHASVTGNSAGENIHSSRRIHSEGPNVNGRTLAFRSELQGCPVPQGVTQQDASTLIGNLVPPLLAELITRQVMASLVPA